jgi:hypothetical protein
VHFNAPGAQFGFHRPHVRLQRPDRRHMMSTGPLPRGPVLREATLGGEMRQDASLPADCSLPRRDACVDFRDALVAVSVNIRSR